MSQNKPTDDQTPRVGVYICHCGGNISDAVDVPAVAQAVQGLPGVAKVHHHSFMCSDPGQALIVEDIAAGRVNRVVVASCAPALHETTFRGAIGRAGLNQYLYEHANIREQVSWVHHGPGATAKAEALVAAAVAKAGRLEALEPIGVTAQAHATVIGGGMAGLTAARALADRGLRVTIIEQSPFLGGQAARLDKLFPDGQPAAELIGDLCAAVLGRPNIQVLTCAQLVAFSGYVGNFSLTVECAPPQGQDLERLALARRAPLGAFTPMVGVVPQEPPTASHQVCLTSGAVVVATGFRRYQPQPGEYGHGRLPQVITLAQLIELMADQPPDAQLRFDGRPVNGLAIIHCVGSRQIPGIHEPGPEGTLNEHCSRVCCTASLQAACQVRQNFPQTQVWQLYRDIRAHGRGHEELYLQAGRSGVRFARFLPETPPVVGEGDEDSALTVSVADSLLGGEELAIGVDLVVLAVGLEPRDNGRLTELMKLPLGGDRFYLEVHPKLRPVELPKAGLYLAGACQAPMDCLDAANAASAAAAKAGAILGAGRVELDPFVARVDPEKCRGEGLCQRACLAEGAIELIETAAGPRAQVNPAMCLGCGVCAAVCPGGAIDLAGWRLNQYEAMVDAIVAQVASQGA